jgi:hypothetical protein
VSARGVVPGLDPVEDRGSRFLPGLVRAAGYPGTSQLAALNSLLGLLTLKLYERRRRSHVQDVVHDQALGIFCGLTVLPKRTHLTGYSYRTTRAHNEALLGALVDRQRSIGLVGGESFNLDSRAGRLHRRR